MSALVAHWGPDRQQLMVSPRGGERRGEHSLSQLGSSLGPTLLVSPRGGKRRGERSLSQLGS